MANFWEFFLNSGLQKPDGLMDPGDPSMPYGPPLWPTPDQSAADTGSYDRGGSEQWLGSQQPAPDPQQGDPSLPSNGQPVPEGLLWQDLTLGIRNEPRRRFKPFEQPWPPQVTPVLQMPPRSADAGNSDQPRSDQWISYPMLPYGGSPAKVQPWPDPSSTLLEWLQNELVPRVLPGWLDTHSIPRVPPPPPMLPYATYPPPGISLPSEPPINSKPGWWEADPARGRGGWQPKEPGGGGVRGGVGVPGMGGGGIGGGKLPPWRLPDMLPWM